MNFINIYKLTKIISLDDEPYLEKWARLFRYEQSVPIIRKQLKKHDKITLLDVGCGQDVLFYNYLQYKFPDQVNKIKYVGLDPLIDKKTILNQDIQTIKMNYEKHFSNTKNRYHCIVLFAVLEHVDDPTNLLLVLSQLLRNDGYLIGTTPAIPAKPVLEFLSYQMGIISKREIDEHKNYFNKRIILNIFEKISKKVKKLSCYHRYFEFGLNNLFVIKR